MNTRKDCDYPFILAHELIDLIYASFPERRKHYNELDDLGADYILASKPDILKGCEFYKDKPIFYNL